VTRLTHVNVNVLCACACMKLEAITEPSVLAICFHELDSRDLLETAFYVLPSAFPGSRARLHELLARWLDVRHSQLAGRGGGNDTHHIHVTILRSVSSCTSRCCSPSLESTIASPASCPPLPPPREQLHDLWGNESVLTQVHMFVR
jgi:hypothetical protein